jgi:hypothetical protein
LKAGGATPEGAVFDDLKGLALTALPERSTVITSPYSRTRSALALSQSAE